MCACKRQYVCVQSHTFTWLLIFSTYAGFDYVIKEYNPSTHNLKVATVACNCVSVTPK